ncbi:amidase signature enzyme [Apiospora saccharicola]
MCLGPLAVRDGQQFIPATCFGGLVQEGKDPKEVLGMLEKDDVWTEEFLSLVLHAPDDAGRIDAFLAEIPSKVSAFAKTMNAVHVVHGQPTPLAPGPYVFDCCTGNLYRPYRLYKDTSDAFVRGALPVGQMAVEKGYSGGYQWLEVSDMIPVPSKLYHLDEDRTKTKKPLAGLRFGVKDTIDVAGLHTGNGSKHFRETYPPRPATAPCVELLIDAGAIMVGKLRCGQWCDAQDPADRLEEPTPINPRGDGFQKPSGSSSGSAAGCASYPWLDFTIGTDTRGSVRHPAAVNGVYGVRPSTGRIQSDMMLVCSPLLDTPGVLTRSAAMAEKVTKVMFSDPPSPPPAQHRRRRFRIFYAVETNTTSTTPKFFSAGGTSPGPEAPTHAGKIMESFVVRLEAHLNCQREEVNLYNLWASKGHGMSLATAASGIYPALVYGHLARTTIPTFAADFKARYQAGLSPVSQPFFENRTLERIAYGCCVNDMKTTIAKQRLKSLADWFNGAVLPVIPSKAIHAATPVTTDELLEDMRREKEATEEDVVPLLLYPQVWARPAYRDEPAPRDCQGLSIGPNGEPFLFYKDFSVYSLAYASGCPDIAVPLGEAPFASRLVPEDIAGKPHLPVAISIMAPRGHGRGPAGAADGPRAVGDPEGGGVRQSDVSGLETVREQITRAFPLLYKYVYLGV